MFRAIYSLGLPAIPSIALDMTNTLCFNMDLSSQLLIIKNRGQFVVLVVSGSATWVLTDAAGSQAEASEEHGGVTVLELSMLKVY